MMPQLILSNNKGEIFVHQRLKMAAFNGAGFSCVLVRELRPLPAGSSLFFMPGHRAIGFDEHLKEFVGVDRYEDESVFPVAAFVIPGFTRLNLPAAQKTDPSIFLPLWPYTAVGWSRGKFLVSSVKVDFIRRQNPSHYSQRVLLKKNISRALKGFPKNRLLKHLSFCALTYNCRNAQNLFLKRWEAPLVVSPACNAACLGCLSKQSKSGFEASHTRISFVPTPQEVAQVAIGHLKNGRQAMVSFGQGCEGEPLLEFGVVKESIRLIRQVTKAGTIHLNTNGFSPKYIRECAAVGLDSVRISLNSFKNEVYQAYYRPKGYGLSDVLASIKAAHQSGLFVSLNLLTFPGGIDRQDEVGRLLRFLKKGYVDLLQLRNLSIDQDFFLKKMPVLSAKPLGILNMIARIRKECPGVRIGYFNRSKEYF